MAYTARQMGSQWASCAHQRRLCAPPVHHAVCSLQAPRRARHDIHQTQLPSIDRALHGGASLGPRVCCQASAAPDAPPSPQSSSFSELQAGALIRCQPDGVPDAAPSTPEHDGDVYLEVLTSWDVKTQSCTAVWAGRMLKLSSPTGTATGALQVSYQGARVSPNSPLVAAFPGWAPALNKQLPRLQQPPWQLLSSFQVVHSLQQLEQEVAAHPQPWCDGTAPGDAPLQGVDYQVSGAGEVVALLSGARGMVMVQLYAGWDDQVTQPVFNPFVVTLLSRAVANKNLTVTMSSISNGLGLTAIISTKKDPFKSWAKHMASFGAQAALVAGSPYYMLLIGRMLGYKEANILHYIRTQGGQVTPAVILAVEAELAKISNKKPTLPWTASSRGKKK